MSGKQIINPENMSEEQKLSFEDISKKINTFLEESGKDTDGVDFIQKDDGTESSVEKEIEANLVQRKTITEKLKFLDEFLKEFQDEETGNEKRKITTTLKSLINSSGGFISNVGDIKQVSLDNPSDKINTLYDSFNTQFQGNNIRHSNTRRNISKQLKENNELGGLNNGKSLFKEMDTAYIQMRSKYVGATPELSTKYYKIIENYDKNSVLLEQNNLSQEKIGSAYSVLQKKKFLIQRDNDALYNESNDIADEKQRILSENITDLGLAGNIERETNHLNNKISSLQNTQQSLSTTISQAKKLLNTSNNTSQIKEIITNLETQVQSIIERKKSIKTQLNNLLKKRNSLNKKIKLSTTKYNNLLNKQNKISTKLTQFINKIKKAQEEYKTVFNKETQSIERNNKTISSFTIKAKNLTSKLENFNKKEKQKKVQFALEKKQKIEQHIEKFSYHQILQEKYTDFLDVFDNTLKDGEIDEGYLFNIFGNEKSDISDAYKDFEDSLNDIIKKNTKLLNFANDKKKYIKGLLQKYLPQGSINDESKRIITAMTGKISNLQKYKLNINQYNQSYFEALKEQFSRAIIRDIFKHTLLMKAKNHPLPSGLEEQFKSFRKMYTTYKKQIGISETTENSEDYSFWSIVNSFNQKEIKEHSINSTIVSMSNFSKKSKEFINTLNSSLSTDIEKRNLKNSQNSLIKKLRDKSNITNKISDTGFLTIFKHLETYIHNTSSATQLNRINSFLDLDNEKGFFNTTLETMGSCSKSVFDLDAKILHTQYNQLLQQMSSFGKIIKTIDDNIAGGTPLDDKQIQKKFSNYRTNLTSQISELSKNIQNEKKQLLETPEKLKNAHTIIQNISNKRYNNEDFNSFIKDKIESYSQSKDNINWLNTKQITKEQYSVLGKITEEFQLYQFVYDEYKGQPDILKDIVFDILTAKDYKLNTNNTKREIREYVKDSHNPINLLSSEQKEKILSEYYRKILSNFPNEQDKIQALLKKNGNNIVTNPYVMSILEGSKTTDEVRDIIELYQNNQLNGDFKIMYSQLVQKTQLSAEDESHFDTLFGNKSYQKGGRRNNIYRIKSIRALILMKNKKTTKALGILGAKSITKNIEKLMMYAEKNNNYADVYNTIIYNSHLSIRNTLKSGETKFIENKPKDENTIQTEHRLGLDKFGDFNLSNTTDGETYLYTGENGEAGNISLTDYLKLLKDASPQNSRNKNKYSKSKPVFEVMNQNKKATVSYLKYLEENPSQLQGMNLTITLTLLEFITKEEKLTSTDSEGEKIFNSLLSNDGILEILKNSDAMKNALLNSIQSGVSYKNYNKYVNDSSKTYSRIKDEGKVLVANTLVSDINESQNTEAKNLAIKAKKEVFTNEADYIEAILGGTEVNSIQLLDRSTEDLKDTIKLTEGISTILTSIYGKGKNPEKLIFIKSVTESIKNSTDTFDNTKYVREALKKSLGEKFGTISAKEILQLKKLFEHKAQNDVSITGASLQKQLLALNTELKKHHEGTEARKILEKRFQEIQVSIDSNNTQQENVSIAINKDNHLGVSGQDVDKTIADGGTPTITETQQARKELDNNQNYKEQTKKIEQTFQEIQEDNNTIKEAIQSGDNEKAAELIKEVSKKATIRANNSILATARVLVKTVDVFSKKMKKNDIDRIKSNVANAFQKGVDIVKKDPKNNQEMLSIIKDYKKDLEEFPDKTPEEKNALAVLNSYDLDDPKMPIKVNAKEDIAQYFENNSKETNFKTADGKSYIGIQSTTQNGNTFAIYDGNSIIYLQKDGEKTSETVHLTPQEKKVITQSPTETLLGLTQFKGILEKVNLENLWDIRENLFNAFTNISGQQFKIEKGYMSEQSQIYFLTSIARSTGLKVDDTSKIETIIQQINTVNEASVGGGEATVNKFGDSKLGERFRNRFLPRGGMMDINISQLKKAIETNGKEGYIKSKKGKEGRQYLRNDFSVEELKGIDELMSIK